MARMRPESADELEEAEATGGRLAYLNDAILERVREDGDPLCVLVAETRWEVFRLGRKDFADAAGVNYKAVQNVETPGTQPQQVTLHRIYHYFVERGREAPGAAEQLLDLAVRQRYGGDNRQHAPPSTLDVMSGRTPITTIQLYQRWIIMKTLAVWEKASGITSGGLWQREALRAIPPFQEVQKTHTKLKLPTDELELATDVWQHDRFEQLESRTIPKPLAQFLTQLELSAKFPTFTVEAIRGAVGCTYEQAQALHAGYLVPFSVIDEVAQTIIPADDLLAFVEEWEAAHERDRDLRQFGPEFVRIRDIAQVTNRQLAVAMDIRAPEDRGPLPAKKKKKRSESFRPSHLIRETLEGLGNSAQAPAGVLVGLVAAAKPYIDDGLTRQTEDHLHDVYGEHRSRNLLRSGASMHSSPVRLDRDYWGIDRQELADALGVSVEEIETIEQGTEAPTRVIRMIEKIGQSRVAIARQRWVDQFEPPEPNTVQNLILHLQRKAGSFATVVHTLSNNRSDTRRGLSVPMLNSFLDGSAVPSWALLKRICAQTELLNFPEKESEPADGNTINTYTQLWQDWCVHYADFLRNSGVTVPLARSLQHLFAQSTESMREFVAQNMAVSYPTQSRILQRIGAGEQVEWTHVSRTLDAAGLSTDSPFYLYIKGLHTSGKVSEGIHGAQQQYEPQIVDSHSYSFGLTSNERKANKLSLPSTAKTKRTQDA